MSIIAVITPKEHDIGDLIVRRALPTAALRHVGPFVFLDHMGPADYPPGAGIAVRPHPHIGLATVTYLFEGEILHRDSLGAVQPIRPGEVNWMTAGRGVTHSERVREEVRASGQRLHGMQAWVALPLADENCAPGFQHIAAEDLPAITFGGARRTLIAGSAFHATSAAGLNSRMFYMDVEAEPGARFRAPDDHAERAAYVAAGEVRVAGQSFGAGTLIAFDPGAEVELEAAGAARVMLLGGEPLDAPRHLWWNFVASSKARLEEAKADWAMGRFPPVPGESEFIPLPER